MKFRLIIVFLIFQAFVAAAQTGQKVSFDLHGITNLPGFDQSARTVFLSYKEDGHSIVDSTLLDNNHHFNFKATADNDTKAAIQFTKPGTSPNEQADPNILTFFVSNGEISVNAKGYLKNAVLIGSALQDEYALFKKEAMKQDTALRILNWDKRSAQSQKDSTKLLKIGKSIDSVQNVKTKYLSTFLNTGIKKPYAPDALLMLIRLPNSNLPLTESYYQQLSPSQKQTDEAKAIEKLLLEKKTQKQTK